MILRPSRSRASKTILIAAAFLAVPTAGVLFGEPAGAGSTTGWLVRFSPGTPPGTMEALVRSTGAAFGFAFSALPAAYVEATAAQAEVLRHAPGVAYVEADAPVEFYDVESKAHIRQPQVVDPVTGVKDASNNPVDGRGVGVAVVDTGIDGLHNDLWYGQNLVRNCKIVSSVCVEFYDTDLTSGHGTHVAAIIAGSGSIDGTLTGVAPGAKLYGIGAGDVRTILWASASFQWIHDNRNSFDPPVKVVTNSWGSGTVYDPNSLITQFVDQLVSDGMVVVFAAGNDGGDGTTVQTSAQCQIPTAGVICVAAYDDLGSWTGTRNGVVAPYSSRGLSTSPSTWPDVSAPGTAVMSARPPAGAMTGSGILNPYYVELSGTSQAAPHVAGIAALMLQKHPTWTPATVEANLKSTAYQFANGAAYTAVSGSGCPGSVKAFDKGCGLVDAYAAVTAT